MNFELVSFLYPLKSLKYCITTTLVTLVNLVHFRHFTQQVAILKKYQFI
jgi:hypothetical protein